jgi:CRISPR system Cascade subunit CasE
MSYLSRVQLRRDGPAQAALAQLLLSASAGDAGHRLIWTLFGDDPFAARDFIYRQLEPAKFLVVSARPPMPPPALWRVETKPYPPRVEDGLRLAFTLRASPTISLRNAAGGRGRRVDALAHTPGAGRRGPKTGLEWLFAREAALGVAFDRANCWSEGFRQVRVPRDSAPPIQFAAIDYHGVFQVTDGEVLARAAVQGVGRAKAYGCGLLLLRAVGPGVPP